MLYNRVYTIGCFDWFHKGHENLLKKLKKYGKQLIVGVHDDVSLEKLKNLKPEDHQDIKTRLGQVKKYADVVYVIPDTDPTYFLNLVLLPEDNKDNACYIRGDDMIEFPGRILVENKIDLLFVPRTKDISSTQIRLARQDI